MKGLYALCTSSFKIFTSNSSKLKHLNTTRNCSHRRLKIENEQKNMLANVLPSILENQRIKSSKDWIRIREKILESKNQITRKSIDSAILTVCISSKQYQLGINYVDFLKRQKIALGLATVGKYFKIIYLKNCPKCIGEQDETEVNNIYQELRKVYKVLDASICENLIYVLSLTKQWRECLRLLDEIKMTSDPNVAVYSVVIAACFRNNDFNLGWKFLQECAEKYRLPSSIAYSSYIDLCDRTQDINNLEKLFLYFQKYDIKCDEETIIYLINFYKKQNWKASTVVLKNNIKCPNCFKLMQKLELQNEEFEDLKRSIFKNVIVGSNVFYKTTPEEVQKFNCFIADMKKYDVIIDGLNVAYSVGTKQSPRTFAFLLESVVKHFANQNKTVLVLGRNHMQKWSPTSWSYILRNADIFLTQTLSHDDPYLLYCALNSGKNTIIVTRDLMRNYCFKLNETKLKILFNRWLLQCQYQLLHVNNNGKVFFKFPLSYSNSAQKIDNVWHIPYGDSTNNGDFTTKWLCLNK